MIRYDRGLSTLIWRGTVPTLRAATGRPYRLQQPPGHLGLAKRKIHQSHYLTRLDPLQSRRL